MMGIIEISTIVLILLKLIGWLQAAWWLVFLPAIVVTLYVAIREFNKEYKRAYQAAVDKKQDGNE
jgi:4-hydroxybenzoate polyprenyltransferase